MHLLKQDIPQPAFLLLELISDLISCSVPVLHIHQIPLQHFGQKLAKETLLAFHSEPALKVKSMAQENSNPTCRILCLDLCMPGQLCPHSQNQQSHSLSFLLLPG